MATSLEDLRSELEGKRRELAELRADREQRQRAQVEDIERQQLQDQIAQVEGEIEQERALIASVDNQQPEEVASPEPEDTGESDLAAESVDRVPPTPPPAPTPPAENVDHTPDQANGQANTGGNE